MKRQMYSIFDKQSGMWCIPYCQATDALGQREFSRIINEPNNVLHDNPEDFDLYYVGFFDDEHGIYESEEKRFVCTGVQVKKIA